MENGQDLLCSRMLEVMSPLNPIVWGYVSRRKIAKKGKWSQIGGVCGCLWTLPPWLSPSYGFLFYCFSSIWVHEAFKTSFMCKLKLGKMPIYGEVMANFFQNLCIKIRPLFQLVSKWSMAIRVNKLDMHLIEWVE